MKVLQKELEESNIKDSELNELNNKHLEEKQMMEQEINKKEQKLQDNNIKMSNLKKSKKLLIKGLNKHERINKLKTNKNDELKYEIRKLKKSNKELGGLHTLLQDVKKRDNKARTFAPSDNTAKSTKVIDILKSDDKKEEDPKIPYKLTEIPKDFDIDKLLGSENEYLDINLSNVNNLIDEMKKMLRKEIIF